MGEAAADNEIAKLNEAIFARLAGGGRAAIDAVCSFTRSLMYHKFTGMPKRGFARRILPSCEAHPVEHWDRLGIASHLRSPVEFEGRTFYTFVYDGPVFYEIAETRLDREDYQRRLAARTVGRCEWRSRERTRRGIIRAHRRTPGPTGEQQEAFAYRVMGELVAGIVAGASRGQ